MATYRVDAISRSMEIVIKPFTATHPIDGTRISGHRATDRKSGAQATGGSEREAYQNLLALIASADAIRSAQAR